MKALLAVLAIVAGRRFSWHGSRTTARPTAAREPGLPAAEAWAGRCTVFADVPAVDRAGRVTAIGRYRCGKPDGGVDTTVYLQLDANGGWANVDRQPMAAAGADATRKRPARERDGARERPVRAGVVPHVRRGTVSNGDRGYQVEAVSKPTDPGLPASSPLEIATRWTPATDQTGV